MSYGIWLYKEIINDSGRKTRLEIEKRDYVGAAIEIGALSGDIVLSIDTDLPTAPIVKSNLSFAIIDTEQVTYSDFFTPDATLYRVKVYDVAGQTQTIRWTGFITPDSFAEPLEYRSAINLTARDNLGYLNDLEFDYNGLTSETHASIKNIINAALTKIGHGSAAGGMSVSWNVAKKTATESGGTYDNIEDAIVSTYTMLGDTWGNVVEALLKGIGCQLRYIDGNSFAVYDIEALSDSATFAAQQVQFLSKSGYREIQPAWKRGIFSQDYELLEKFPLGYPASFSGDIQRVYSPRTGQTFQMLMHEVADGWTVHNNGEQWGLFSPFDGITNGNANAIYIPFLDMDDNDRPDIYVERGVELNTTEVPITVEFSVTPMRFWGVRYIASSGAWRGLDRGPTSSGMAESELNTVFFNVVFYAENGNVYYLRRSWMQWGDLADDDKVMSVGYIYDLRGQEDVTAEITCMSLPSTGRLAIRFYPPKGRYFDYINRVMTTIVCDFNLCSKIHDISFAVDNNETEGGRSRKGDVNAAHNVTGAEEYVFGQIPKDKYGITFYKGGIYKNDTPRTPYAYFKRTTTATETDNLLDLIGRETIQYHKKSFNLLSGTVQVLTRTNLMTFGTLSYGGKRYLPLSAALNLLENTMSITSMLEIEDYADEAGIVFSDYAGKNSYSGRSGYSGGGGSSGGSSISQHGQLAGRDAEDSHPMSAITGLSDLFEYDAVNDVLIIKKAIVSAYDAQFLHSNS